MDLNEPINSYIGDEGIPESIFLDLTS